jgi:predicted Rossmann-fold nucleotide-binding protein
MRLLVCGGRDFNDKERLRDAMNDVAQGQTDLVVIHGGARGADTLAGEIAREVHVKIITFHADWERNGKRAGPIRNQQMLDEGRPDIVLAMPGGAGTADMVRRARAAGVTVVEHRK